MTRKKRVMERVTESAFDTFLVRLGKLLQQKRVDSGRTQDMLAVELEVTRSTVGNYECGRRNMTLKQLFELSQAIGKVLVVRLESPDYHTQINEVLYGDRK